MARELNEFFLRVYGKVMEDFNIENSKSMFTYIENIKRDHPQELNEFIKLALREAFSLCLFYNAYELIDYVSRGKFQGGYLNYGEEQQLKKEMLDDIVVCVEKLVQSNNIKDLLNFHSFVLLDGNGQYPENNISPRLRNSPTYLEMLKMLLLKYVRDFREEILSTNTTVFHNRDDYHSLQDASPISKCLYLPNVANLAKSLEFDKKGIIFISVDGPAMFVIGDFYGYFKREISSECLQREIKHMIKDGRRKISILFEVDHCWFNMNVSFENGVIRCKYNSHHDSINFRRSRYRDKDQYDQAAFNIAQVVENAYFDLYGRTSKIVWEKYLLNEKDYDRYFLYACESALKHVREPEMELKGVIFTSGKQRGSSEAIDLSME